MPRKDIEIRLELLDVDLEVRHRLRPIDEYRNSPRVGEVDDVMDRGLRAERVADVRDRKQADAAREETLEFVELEDALVGDRGDAQAGALAFAGDLPGDEVGVVLHGADDDLVALGEALGGEAVGDKVDCLGGAADEDDLGSLGGVEEAADLFARLVVGGGGALAEVVDAAVDVGVARLVKARDGVDDGARLLGRGGVVEVDERLAVHAGGEDREIAADPLDVDRVVIGAGMGVAGGETHVSTSAMARPWNFSATARSSWARIGTTRICSRTSLAKA